MAVNNKTPLISIVVVTRNRFDELRECLKALLKQDYPEREIIVIDSSSENGTVNLQEYIPKIKYYRTEHRGISYGRNQGIFYSKGEYVAFTDDDCIPRQDWLRNLYEVAVKEGADIVGGNTYFPDGKTLQSSEFYISAFGDFKSCISDPDIDKITYRYLFFIGSNLLIKRKVFSSIKFDEYYRYYFDETDFCVRAQLAGYKLSHSPDAIIIHMISQKGWQRKDISNVFRNPPYFVAKNFGISFAYLFDLFIRTLKTIKAYCATTQKNIVWIIIPNVICGLIGGLKARGRS